MFSDLEVKCWEGEHERTVLYICIPFFLLWIIGIPLFFLHQLNKYKDVIREIEERKDYTYSVEMRDKV